MQRTFTVVTFHFGDAFWAEQLLTRVLKAPNSVVQRVFVVDQNRDGERLPRVEDERVKFVSFPENGQQISRLGHDHAYSLNMSLGLDFETTHILFLDSDCIPSSANWLELVCNVLEISLAADPIKAGLTHPCLCVLPTSILEYVDFEEGLMELGIDTGRLLGLQIMNAGFTPHILQAKSSPWGRGHFYLGGAFYHHGSGSFLASSDQRLAIQVSAISERYFRRKIERNDFKLRFSDAVVSSAIGVAGIVRSAIRLFFAPRG